MIYESIDEVMKAIGAEVIEESTFTKQYKFGISGITIKDNFIIFTKGKNEYKMFNEKNINLIIKAQMITVLKYKNKNNETIFYATHNNDNENNKVYKNIKVEVYEFTDRITMIIDDISE